MQKPKKICFVVAVPLTAEAFLLKHIEKLASEYEVYLVANFENNNRSILQKAPLTDIGHVSIHRDIHIPSDISSVFQLRKFFKSHKFDLVVSITPKAGLLGMAAAKMAGIPFRIHVFTGQVWHTQTGLMKKLLMMLDRLVARLTTHIWVDGSAQRSFLIQQGIISGEKSHVLGKGSISGVDLDRFTPRPDVRSKWRTQLGYAEDEVVFMFLGRLNRDKGVLDLAAAFSRLVEVQPNVRLLLVGFDEENLAPEIAKLINRPEKVHFFGPTRQPEVLLQAADVFCLPSYREGFGTSVIEASALGIPILCSDTYGLMETIIEEETGLRHAVGNVESIFVQMQKLSENQQLREKLGQGGQAYVRQFFSADTIAQAWQDFINQILK